MAKFSLVGTCAGTKPKGSNRSPRYYQQIAINRAVQSIVQDRRRVLLTMATGTGKLVTAILTNEKPPIELSHFSLARF